MTPDRRPDRTPGRVERTCPAPQLIRPASVPTAPEIDTQPQAAAMHERRLTRAVIEGIAAGLTERDWAIMNEVARVRVLTGRQLQLLHFSDLQGAHCDRTRRRVLSRLTSLTLLTPLERRIGGARAGSAGLVFALGPAGQRLVAPAADTRGTPIPRARQPQTPTDRFLGHCLAISQLYVDLVLATRLGQLALQTFRGEPAAWWQDDSAAWVKPDAYVVVGQGDVEDAWAIEVDRATESLPTLKRKLLVYLDLAARSDDGPDRSGLPRVLITVPHEPRQRAVHELIRGLPPPADQLFAVVAQDRAVQYIVRVLRE
jgi:protein involved in plasmid replication-relaxation